MHFAASMMCASRRAILLLDTHVFAIRCDPVSNILHKLSINVERNSQLKPALAVNSTNPFIYSGVSERRRQSSLHQGCRRMCIEPSTLLRKSIDIVSQHSWSQHSLVAPVRKVIAETAIIAPTLTSVWLTTAAAAPRPMCSAWTRW